MIKSQLNLERFKELIIYLFGIWVIILPLQRAFTA